MQGKFRSQILILILIFLFFRSSPRVVRLTVSVNVGCQCPSETSAPKIFEGSEQSANVGAHRERSKQRSVLAATSAGLLGGAVVRVLGRQRYVVAERLQAFDQGTLQTLRLQPVEIVRSQIAILHVVFE